MIKTEGLDHIAITVKDMQQTIKWYTEVIGLEHVHKDKWDGVPAFLLANGSGIAVFPANVSLDDSGPANEKYDVRHFAFRVNRENFERAKKIYREKNLEYKIEDHEICYSIYTKDPDGYIVELTTYEI
ncbi:MAG: VOC family protein [Ignavibacteria bacterium]|nr:VOC family protein [Ignavibacteria bacterium]